MNHSGYCTETALSLLVWKNCNECVAVAINAGADVNMRGYLGQVPLFLALKTAQSNNEERSAFNRTTNAILSSLMKAGADVKCY